MITLSVALRLKGDLPISWTLGRVLTLAEVQLTKQKTVASEAVKLKRLSFIPSEKYSGILWLRRFIETINPLQNVKGSSLRGQPWYHAPVTYCSDITVCPLVKLKEM